jgi:hypothetical protein
MRRSHFVLPFAAGVALAAGISSSFSGRADADGGAAGCRVSSEFGGLRGATPEGWLLFEDQHGTVRVIDNRCQVKRTVGRQ